MPKSVVLWVLVLAGATAGAAFAQSDTPADDSPPALEVEITDNGSASPPPERTPAEADEPGIDAAPESEPQATEDDAEFLELAVEWERIDWPQTIQPNADDATLTWIAVAAILLVMFRLRPLATIHNVDALVLAAVPVLLTLQSAADWTAFAHYGLVVITAYWFVRGAALIFARNVPSHRFNLAGSASLVLLIAGLLVSYQQIDAAPLSRSSVDGTAGAQELLSTEQLPYGRASHLDTQPPLVYLAHVPGVEVAREFRADADNPAVGLAQADRNSPSSEISAPLETDRAFHQRSAWTVNTLLAALFFLALLLTGWRVHSIAVGAALTGVAALFPGTHDCLAHPEIMTPAVVLAWTLLLATWSPIGPLLSMALLTFGGLASPWLWFGVPVLLACFVRQGFAGLLSIVGLLGGLAGVVMLVEGLVAPSVPRAAGALRAADAPPTYAATMVADEGLIELEHHDPPTDDPAGFALRRWFWRQLINSDEPTIENIGSMVIMPNGTPSSDVRYREIAADGHARKALNEYYGQAVEELDWLDQLTVKTRTLLEATWLPEDPALTRGPGTWEFIAAQQPEQQARTTWIRRAVKLAAAVLVLVASVVLFVRKKPLLPQLAGAALLFTSVTLIASWYGPATNWVWLLPAILMTLAAFRTPAAAAARGGDPGSGNAARGPAPRISVQHNIAGHQ